MLPPGRLAFLSVPVSCLMASAAMAQVPEKALKYHEALLKRPHHAALFDRFFNAWLDEQPVETLGGFLQARATSDGGPHLTVLAIYQLRRGLENEALETLGKAIAALPDDAALPMERAKLHLGRLEFDQARNDLAMVSAGKDEVLGVEAGKLIGKSWLREGKPDEAIKVWDGVLAAHADDEDLLEDLVETAAAEAGMAQSLVYIDRLIAVSRDPYQKTVRTMRRGDLLAQSGKIDEAVAAYAATLEQVGADSWLEREVLARIEKLFRRQDRIRDLIGELKKLAEAHPQRRVIHRELAKLEASQGEVDVAIGRFREVLKRSPGEGGLHEEFVRLLVDGERFDAAVTELEKLIERSPADAGLYLQVAALRSRQTRPDAVLAALKKAHELLGRDWGSGLRIAGLMLQYGLTEPGESLLKDLAATGEPATVEALAAHYARTGRKAEAVELLKTAGAGDDLEVLLRTCGVISGLGEPGIAFEILSGRVERFASEPRVLTALVQAALAAGKPAEAVPQAIKLVRVAKQSVELAESIGLASRVIVGAGKSDDVRAALTAQSGRTAAETCLLASLLESAGQLAGSGTLLESDPDPLVIRFHAALLDRRGDFGAAVAVMSRLADTAEGRKAAFFKDLSELQQRAGRPTEALATVERWKLAASGDKSAWIAASRLLRESGKPEDAVRMARQAVSRFEGDVDLAASLATLHDEAGQWREAEAIYWKLYDEGQSPAEQARWAALLAQLAMKSGRFGDLEEKLRERARGNRRSMGPILALAELARASGDDENLRERMEEALRLQPKDLDVRLQAATAEEQAGNPRRALALLEEGLAFDQADKVRGVLAQAYFRLGQPVKGLRELRHLSGHTGFDPRAADDAAMLLGRSRLFDEAIGFLKHELPGGGDWRSRYLLAVLLEEDGREDEAVPMFLDLLQAAGDIQGLAVPAARGHRNTLSAECREVALLVSARRSAYTHRDHRVPVMRNFSLPDTPEDARQFALIHLATMLKTQIGADALTRERIEADGVDQLDFIVGVLTSARPDVDAGLLKWLEVRPTQPGLMEYLAMSGKFDRGLAMRILEQEGELDTAPRFLAGSLAAAGTKPDNPAWAPMMAAAEDCLTAQPKPLFATLGSRLLAMLRGEGDCPEEHRPAVRRLLLEAMAGMLRENPESPHDGYALEVLSVAGTAETWLAELNAVLRASRQPGARNPLRGSSPAGQLSMSFGRVGGGEFALPPLEGMPFGSIPPKVLGQLATIGGGKRQDLAFSIEDLLSRLSQIQSPLVRAWLAVASGNRDAMDATLAVVPPPEEAGDFELLRAFDLLGTGQSAAALAPLIRAREAAGANRELAAEINRMLISAAGFMSPEERQNHYVEIETACLQFSQSRAMWEIHGLVARVRQFGFEPLASRLAAVSPSASPAWGRSGMGLGMHTGVPASMRGILRPTTRAPGTPDPIRKLVAAKRYEAAAIEVMQRYRIREADHNPSQAGYELANLMGVLGTDGRAELLKLVNPGNSKSLVRRLEYIEVCEAGGEKELAAEALDAISTMRPNDEAIATRLVLTTTPTRMERRLELMNRVCEGEGFFEKVAQFAGELGPRKNNAATLDFFELVARWLETADPAKLSAVNLSWVSFYAKHYFLGDCTSGLPSLFSEDRGKDEKRALIDRQTALGSRLARAMLRHGACAEEGFRLLAGARAWKMAAADLDACARTVLLTSAGKPSWRALKTPLFTLDRGHGVTESGLSLSEFSSASWLVRRMKPMTAPDGFFSADFIAALRQCEPVVGDFLASLGRELTVEELPLLWKSEVVASRESRLARMLRPAMMRQMARAPGASGFFADEIAGIVPMMAVTRYPDGDSEDTALLFSAALAAAGPAGMDGMARAISRAVFGERNPDFDSEGVSESVLERVRFMGDLCGMFADEPAMMVRLQSTFHGIGIPLGTSDSIATRPFTNLGFASVDEVEAFLESLGWLADLDRWEPYVALIYRQRSTAGNVAGSLRAEFLLADALQHLRLDRGHTDELIQRLKDRKTGRFGSLVVAAALSSGAGRSALMDQAFTEFSTDLANLAEPRAERISLLLPWLGDEVRASLPEKFHPKRPGPNL